MGRTGQGFTAYKSDANKAVKVLFYRVELDNLLGSPESTVLFFNTQRGDQEYVSVTISDQGFSGDPAAGASKKYSITIPVTVVASNDPPVLVSEEIEFTAEEDIESTLTGLSVSDPDLDESLDSPLAMKNWMGFASNQVLLNKMQITASLVHGVLKLAYRRNLHLISTASTTYMTITYTRYGHDVCRVMDIPRVSDLLDPFFDEAASRPVPNYQKLCIFDNIGSSVCPTGTEAGCNCNIDGACDVEQKVVIHLNRSLAIDGFQSALVAAINDRDRTCGGMPIYASPNNFTSGRTCEGDADCIPATEHCVPGVTCGCCANVSFICSTDADCTNLGAGSACGCTPGGLGTCGPYYTDEARTLGAFTDIVQTPRRTDVAFGTPCTYTGPGSNQCLSGAFASSGSNLARIVDLLAPESLGSKEAVFFGPIVDINRALASVRYLGDRDYNRFYRIPPEQRDPLTFKIEADSVDLITITANDLGNSGGSLRDEQSSAQTIPIRVLAINDRPQAVGPASVKAYEDVPLHFLQAKYEADSTVNHPLKVDGLMITDPDYKDYLFDTRLFTLNVSCEHGRLFLNEEFLVQPGVSSREGRFGPDPRIQFVDWEGGQEYRGVHFADQDNLGIRFDEPQFGAGCQFRPQCSDGANLKSDDSPWGFFTTQVYGTVYPRHAQEGSATNSDLSGWRREVWASERTGCGICPGIVGNKFISIRGRFADINEALAIVTYLPDPHFNTRYGIEENILLQVSDNGAQGNSQSELKPLTHEIRIPVVVESINDRPLVGRRLQKPRFLMTYDIGRTQPELITADYSVDQINKTREAKCFGLSPSSADYTSECGAAVREYIDVDEDTRFYVGPHVLWIHDVDANEANLMPNLDQRRYCCPPAGESGCTCGRACRCGTALCRCATPDVCGGGIAGNLLVSIEVGHGLLSWYPPPGRTAFSSDVVTFMTNVTAADMKEGGLLEPCDDQLTCMLNVSRLQIRTDVLSLQLGIEQNFLSYTALPDYFGRDQMKIFVSDLGNTDECYNATLTAEETINIRVVAINDPPVISGGINSVLIYRKGQRCYVDFGEFNSAANNDGLSTTCRLQPEISRLPTTIKSNGEIDAIQVSDVDLGFSEAGNVSVTFTLGDDEALHSTGGALLISQILTFSDNWFSEYRQEGLYNMMIEGRIAEVNLLLQQLKYDADPVYQGYVPFVIQAYDRLNYGECSGRHVCGAEKPEGCSDSREAEPHVKPQEGLTRAVIDMTIGSPVRCNASDCLSCNSEPGCGWCFGVCGGKCMIGGIDKPEFETCPISVEDKLAGIIGGLEYRQCEIVVSSMTPVLVGVPLGLLLGAILMFIFVRWTKRRHGGLLQYLKKKRLDAGRAAVRLNVMPPDTANYTQFFIHLIVCGSALIATLIALQSEEPLCQFQKTFLIEKAERVTMSLDNCRVRFVPSRLRAAPDNSLTAIKMQIAHTEDPLIKVVADTCGANATLQVINTKPQDVRYNDYWCHVELLVPDKLVLPEVTIEATGDNLTTVRSGPMDLDSPEFGLVFGPNALTLKGNLMRAHLQNISAKYFNYDVVGGSLIAVDLTTTMEGNFKSVSADMTVTSKKRTSVEFWQKSDNKVCLTAAKGSLYVDDACQSVCTLRSAGNSSRRDLVSAEPVAAAFGIAPQATASAPPSAQDLSSHRGEQEAIPSALPLDLESLPTPDHGASLRVLGASTLTIDGLQIVDPVASDPRTPWVCTGDPATDEEWQCVNYNATGIALSEKCPLGSKFATKQDVYDNRIDGCTDLKRCIVTESSQCLCRPLCDMANLDPPGVCNTAGQCCQILCGGYSRADMFPDEDMPRCGLEVDSVKYPWCTGKLGQFFRFTSDTGQISFQTLAGCEPDSPGNCSGTNKTVHSFKGAAATDAVPFQNDIQRDGKVLLAGGEGFHPGGATFPIADVYVMSLEGPGTPDYQYGRFMAAKEIRHLVLPAWIMTVVSYDLLAPKFGYSNTRVDPGFCPAYTPTDSGLFRKRLIAMHRMLLDTVQLYPPEEEPKIMPIGSLIAFVPLYDGLPIYFGKDLKTNTNTVSFIDPFDYPLLLMLLGMGIGIPFVFGGAVTISLFLKGRARMHEYRISKLKAELTMMNLSAILAGEGPDIDDEDNIPMESVIIVRGKTNFYFLYEDFIGRADTARSAIWDPLVVIQEQIISVFPVIFPLLLGSRVKEVYTKQKCEYRPDICTCLAETGGLSMVPIFINALAFTYLGIAFAELCLHYLNVSYNYPRKVLRVLFYVFFFLMVFATVFVILTIMLFVVMGILVKPALTLPYAIAVFGALTIASMYFSKLSRFQQRVQRAVTKEILMYKNKVAKSIPPKLLDATMGSNIQEALLENGLAGPSIIIKVFAYLVAMCGVYFFLFTAFEAFTDQNNFEASIANDVALLTVLGLSWMAIIEDDSSEAFHQVDLMKEKIMESQKRVLDIMAHQIEMAQRLLSEMQGEMQEPGAGEDEEDGLIKK